MCKIEFSPILECEISTLGVLRQQAWSATYRGIYPDDMIDQFDFKWHEARDLQRFQSPNFYHWLIKENDKNIGYLTIRTADFVYLYSLYLLPIAQKHGYGQQAMTFTARFCEEYGRPIFRCHCQPDNTNAMGFYRRMGGHIVEEDFDNIEKWQNTAVFEFSVCDFLPKH